MAQVKVPKTKGVPNKHLHARTTFLFQAATYLTLQATAKDSSCVAKTSQEGSNTIEVPKNTHSPLALSLGSQLHAVSRRGQVRLSTKLKRSMCKTCSTVLIPGRTSSQVVENLSKGGKKPWADVLVIECSFCGTKKRFPTGANRQQSKHRREAYHEAHRLRSDTNEPYQSITPALQADNEINLGSG